MKEYLRYLSVFCPVVLSMGGLLQAQPKAEVIIDVTVMQVNSERAERLAAIMAPDGSAGLLSALMIDTDTKIVSRSQLRASEGMKTQLQIGDPIPYVTGSLTVDLTPQVHNREEVALHVEITVSAVKQLQPVIGQRKNIADLCLREGEMNILSGLRENQDSSTVNGLPGLVDIPVLGRVPFGGSEKERQALMIALIPHVVRTPAVAP